MSDIHLATGVRPTCEVPVQHLLPEQEVESQRQLLTNLIATGWLVRRFAPEGQGLRRE